MTAFAGDTDCHVHPVGSTGLLVGSCSRAVGMSPLTGTLLLVPPARGFEEEAVPTITWRRVTRGRLGESSFIAT